MTIDQSARDAAADFVLENPELFIAATMKFGNVLRTPKIVAAFQRYGDARAAQQREADARVAALLAVIEQIAIDSNEDWHKVRDDPMAAIRAVHSLAVDVLYPAAAIREGSAS